MNRKHVMQALQRPLQALVADAPAGPPRSRLILLLGLESVRQPRRRRARRRPATP